MHVSFNISAIPPTLYWSTSPTLLQKAFSSKGNYTDQVTKVPADSLAPAAGLHRSAAGTLNSDYLFFRCHMQTLFCLSFLCGCTPEVEREELSYYIHASKYLVRPQIRNWNSTLIPRRLSWEFGLFRLFFLRPVCLTAARKQVIPLWLCVCVLVPVSCRASAGMCEHHNTNDISRLLPKRVVCDVSSVIFFSSSVCKRARLWLTLFTGGKLWLAPPDLVMKMRRSWSKM